VVRFEEAEEARLVFHWGTFELFGVSDEFNCLVFPDSSVSHHPQISNRAPVSIPQNLQRVNGYKSLIPNTPPDPHPPDR
jgi:hypothetical protein